MRPIFFLLISTTLSIIVFGAISINYYKAKRTTTNTVYFSNSLGTITLTANKSIFDDASITSTAAIKLNNCVAKQLFKNEELTGSVKVSP